MQPRGIFHDEDQARRAADELIHRGFTARVFKDAFAGDDDDEDAAWAITTDAPAVMFELVVERHDGWYDEPIAPPADPLRLPSAPKRIKNPGAERNRP